ncbi:MAG: hypothetical protein K2P88_14975 [Chitinophagaceae bacterium]|nr:hypothetical protein [Chitinophagaceae bacterium]
MLYSLAGKEKIPLTEKKDSITGIKTSLLAGVQLYPFPARFGSYHQDFIYLNSTFKQPNSYFILG